MSTINSNINNISNIPLFEKYTIQKIYQYMKVAPDGKRTEILDPKEIKNIKLQDFVDATTFQLEFIDNTGKSHLMSKEALTGNVKRHSLLDPEFIEPTLEKKTLVGHKYAVYKMNSEGVNVRVNDPDELAKVFDGDHMAGSIVFTRDIRHRGWLHVLVHLVQSVHSKLFGRTKNFDQHLSHGIIITGKAEENLSKGRAHPYLIAHGVFQGIRTAERDYLAEYDTTGLVIYRPKEEKFREMVKKYSEATAYNSKTQLPKMKAGFSIKDMFLSFFNSNKHRVCGKHGSINKAAMERASNLIADIIFNQQLMDNDGKKPMPFFCSPYVMAIAQASYISKELKNGREDLADAEYEYLEVDRNLLAKKIYGSLQKRDEKNAFAQRIFDIYHSSKLARIDSRFTMSAYGAKVLDKMSG